ncbi:chromate transport protein ChrA [Aquitalea magnusonii]|uniref:Chromate transport protein ChrA n=1 Tax=Aquitalea magnusonii TaxID=332411 RepID=A0A3G9G931_9NEIS|nr:chromate efflux transporter [Aquitalea magnusonii]BBF84470.1 chromate transport protein ChrA [Aquitalea magnusonii]
MHNTAEQQVPAPVSLRQAFGFWLKLGFLSFGGPAGQIAILHQELVEKRRWISERRFLHALNYCMLLPGPEAQQLVTYIGWLMHRSAGGIMAGGLFVLPSLFILIGLSWGYLVFGQLPLLAGLFYGLKPAIVAIVLQAALRIGQRVLKNRGLWLLTLAAFLGLSLLQLPFPLIILSAALTGHLAKYRWPAVFARANTRHGQPGQHGGPALIDDDTPTPAHARFSRGGLLRVVLAGGLLWCGPMLLLYSLLGWQHPFTQMGWFFTKAALLTFGGAYAVLPYVYQGAVAHYGWLSAGQMMDGLALGETTPGPLIMVVAFVGFVGGYQHVSMLSPALAGTLAATLVTWFTFLPSFLFILAGGPLIERSHDSQALSAPLTAITAAVVGVIANLALFFGWQVLWPQGWQAGPDWTALLIALAAAVALLRYKLGIIRVMAAAACCGYLLHS